MCFIDTWCLFKRRPIVGRLMDATLGKVSLSFSIACFISYSRISFLALTTWSTMMARTSLETTVLSPSLWPTLWRAPCPLLWPLCWCPCPPLWPLWGCPCPPLWRCPCPPLWPLWRCPCPPLWPLWGCPCPPLWPLWGCPCPPLWRIPCPQALPNPCCLSCSMLKYISSVYTPTFIYSDQLWLPLCEIN